MPLPRVWNTHNVLPNTYKEVCCHVEHISKKKVAPGSFCSLCLVVVYSLRLEWSGHRIINSATISPPNLALSSSVGRRYAGRKILVYLHIVWLLIVYVCSQIRGVRDPRCARARLVVGGGRLRHVRHPALRGRVGRTAPRRRRPARHRRQTVWPHRLQIGQQLHYTMSVPPYHKPIRTTYVTSLSNRKW